MILPRHVPPHLMQTAVVFDDLRLVYAMVPKAGSTAILWALAEVAGLEAEDFARSRKLEVTPALTVHDMTIWGSHGLQGRSAKELERILWSDDWFRLTVVREPVRRLWSAWVSKVLVRDPRLVATFGTEEWFPPVPSTSKDVVESFRDFVRTLPTRAGDWHDPHWAPQVDLIGVPDIVYGHVGHVEQLAQTEAMLGEYLGSRGGRLPALGRENPSLLPFTHGLFDRSTLDACNRWTARDREAFGYEPVAAVADEPDDAWHATVEANIPAIRAVIERHGRIADLRRLLADADRRPRRARIAALHRLRSSWGSLRPRLRRGTAG